MSASLTQLNPLASIAALPPISIYAEPEDFRSRALAAELLLAAVKESLTKLAKDAAANDPSNIVRDAELVASIDAHLCDLCADISGAFSNVAEHITDERYAGCARGPMHRSRL